MYKALLVSPDGDYITDFHNTPTVQQVEEACADMGSRWYFYPFEFVVSDHPNKEIESLEIISASYPYEDMKGKTVHETLMEVKRSGATKLSTN